MIGRLWRLIIFADFNLVMQVPPSVTHLYFGNRCGRAITHLPPTVTSLSYDGDWDITNFPPHLTNLTFGYSTRRILPEFPLSLTHLNCAVRALPALSQLANLEVLQITGDVGSYSIPDLPLSLKILDINTNSTYPIRFQSLPPALKVFRTTTAIPPIDNLPPLLTELELGDTFNQPVDNLPSSLTRIKFGKQFNQPVDKLPLSLAHLSFHEDFNQPVDSLPPSLIRLHFGKSFNRQINHLPASLRHLHLGVAFSHSLSCLPSITHLSIAYGVLIRLDFRLLPPSLTHALLGTHPHGYSPRPPPSLRHAVRLPHHLSHYYFGGSFGTMDTCLLVPKDFKIFTFETFDPRAGGGISLTRVYVDFETRLIRVSCLVCSPYLSPSSLPPPYFLPASLPVSLPPPSSLLPPPPLFFLTWKYSMKKWSIQ